MLDIVPKLDLDFSPYSGLYDIIVGKENMYRRLRDEMDWSFVNESMIECYDSDRGRIAINPEFMLKLLVIKTITDLSDADLVEEVKVNMAMKYFLNLAPEAEVCHKSNLTNFRRFRLAKCESVNILLCQTIKVAKQKGIIKKSSSGKYEMECSIDSTHINAMGRVLLSGEAITIYCKRLINDVKSVNPDVAAGLERVPDKFKNSWEAVEFGKRMLAYVRDSCTDDLVRMKVMRTANRLQEVIEDLEEYGSYCPADRDARRGHKSVTRTEDGYKDHIITETNTGLIVAAESSPMNVSDTTVGRELIQKVVTEAEAGGEDKITAVLGDAAYSSSDILDYLASHDIELYASPNRQLGTSHPDRNGFTYNKDAQGVICPAGHLSISSTIRTYKEENNRKVAMYYFDVDRCRCCPFRHGCYKEGSTTKSFSVTINTEAQKAYLKKMKLPSARQKLRKRNISERVNAELKSRCGLRKAKARGMETMTVQMAVAMFTYNLKVILRKTAPKAGE